MMFNENDKPAKAPEDRTHCVGVHELMDWEIMRYRNVVTMHRRELSIKEGRCVDWNEAEEDFSKGNCVSLSDGWRVEFCGLICPHRCSCVLALHFLHSKHTEALHQAG